MAKNTTIVSKNIFQNKSMDARITAFRQKWLELICQLEKSGSIQAQESVQTIHHEL